MQKREIVTRVLVPADQHAPEAIHPTMRALHDPPAGLEAGLLLERLSLFPPRPDVGREAKLSQQLTDLVVVIPFVQAYALRLRWGGRRARDRDAHERRLDHLEVVPIGPLDSKANGDAAAVGEDAPFGANLPAVGRIPAHLFPPQGAAWSSRRPWLTTPSQCPASHRIPPNPASTTPGRRQRPPTLGNGGAPSYWNRGWCHSGHSTGNRCGGRRRWHPWPGGHRRGTDGTRAGAACAAGVEAGCTPITCQGYANHGERSLDQYSYRSLL
jgi:hypothetical protein